jgi:type IV pilus assembly protein PilE
MDQPIARAHKPDSVTATIRSGFTLLEMLITLVVVAILAAVVYPSFMDSVRKGRRSEAITGINAVQQAQERFRANKASFSTSVTNAASADPPGLGLSATPGTGLYTLSLADVSDSGYTVIATAVDGKSQASDSRCLRMSIRAAGGNLSQGSSGSTSGAIDFTDANRCWSR